MIVVMDQGRIVEQGTHEQLLEHGQLYREIHDLQLADHAGFAEEMEQLEEEKVMQMKERDEM
jgi:ABC-type transport system involved in cytochrome bd biosynthesis fused ATPase/permease subunit